ncbi:MAG TPA: YggS family pyridoxal phosphate-dependent enzyme [Actinomycetes bacterium]|nr:YggS family pyridoxal phosphate-dependent enzyme [Actinomycetes bacterium]
MTHPAPHDARTEQLAASLARLDERLTAACVAAGRARDEITVIAVTKTFPAADVRRLAGLGLVDIGENRDQEAASKAAECADLDLRWHFIGQLQTNKVRSVAHYAHLVHSVDRDRLVPALAAAADRVGRELGCLVQVSLQVTEGRGGVDPSGMLELADLVAAAPALRLAGLMAMAPLDENPARAFGRLEPLIGALRAAHPAARIVSAGMSEDLEAAIAAGATHVRVGTALLGSRPSLR